MKSIPCILGIILEERFFRLPDGSLYSPGGFGDAYWERYLSHFDGLVIIARVASAGSANHSWAKIADPRVQVRGLPLFIGPTEFVRRVIDVYKSFDDACEGVHALLARAPGTLSAMLVFRKRRRHGSSVPLGVELIGDPYDVFKSGIGGLFSIILRVLFVKVTKDLCLSSDAVLYVTQTRLQERYPAAHGVPTCSCSDIDLGDEYFASAPGEYKLAPSHSNPLTGFMAASMEVPYKGVDILITALSQLAAAGAPIQFRIAGDGRLRSHYEAMAARIGVADRIVFLGHISREQVANEMVRAGIYVQPSLTEGLPRAVIEACAAALPVIASDVGGMPELLIHDDLVPPGDADALADRINEVINNPSRMSEMSARNLATARRYERGVLHARRTAFYAELRQLVIENVSRSV